MKISITAPAKLNLYLEVLGKLSNGYHELKSQVVFMDLSDELTFEKADSLQIFGVEIQDNIILKTAKKMQQQYAISQGVEIQLTKNIPLSAGLGGGSTDAAATIIALKKLWEIDTTDEELYSLAAEIGADVPCCLYYHISQKNSVKFSGFGEILSEADAPKNLHFALVNPLQEISTAEIFSKIGSFNLPSESKDYNVCRNDLEPVAQEILPEIGDILNTISEQKNCQLSRMTGSGATCFGVFGNAEEAQKACENLKNNFPNYWVQYSNLA